MDETGRAFAAPASARRKARLDFEISQGKNTKVTLGDRRSVIGRHSTDLKTGTLDGILKQLGLKPEEIEE